MVDVATGDGVVLQGVNFFSVDAQVRLTDKLTETIVRNADGYVWGDVETPPTEEIDGETRLINDCRVHDRLTFRVPDDLPPGIYEIRVVVPNTTGIAVFGDALESNVEFINVVPPPTARFQIVTETIYARKETSPDWLGSDEVGLHTMAYPLFLDGTFPKDPKEECYSDIQQVDFDSGTKLDITRNVFTHDQPILGMVMSVLGYEIDSQRAYNKQVTDSMNYFRDLVKQELKYVWSAIELLGGASFIGKMGWTGWLLAGIAVAITVGIDGLIAWWAPADPIINDAFGLTISDLAALTNTNVPAPEPSTHETASGIVVNINTLMPPVKVPQEYHETREYVSSDQDSRYSITYRFNRIA